MHYILPQRDLIAGSIEAMVGAHGFEGLVMLGSCDKILPGMLMAAVRLNLPTLFLTAGAMMPCRIGGKVMTTPDLKEAIGRRSSGKIDQETFLVWQERFCATSGTCSMMGTANTMGCFLEATGLAPFGSTTMLAFDAAKVRQAREVGERIVDLTRRNKPFRDFFTPRQPGKRDPVRLRLGRIDERRPPSDGLRLAHGDGDDPGRLRAGSRPPSRSWASSSPRPGSTSPTSTRPAASWP